MVGAAVLDTDTYEEVEADRRATTQAFLVVLLVSLAAGIGALGFGHRSVEHVFVMGTAALIGWASWALLTYQIGGRLMPTRQTEVDLGQLLRTLGFSAAPGTVAVAGILPLMAIPAFALASVWMLVSMIVAVRQALDYESTGRAVVVCAVAWTLALGIVGLLGFWTHVVA